MTGHLVFSTLHTNSAPETIVRLLELGIDPYSFADALLAVLAQRLARTLCTSCRVPGPVREDLLATLRAEYDASTLFDALGYTPESEISRLRSGGCGNCHGSGYRDRMAIHELLTVSDEIREMILDKRSSAEIKRKAREQGMVFLRQAALEKVYAAVTTLREVNKVTFIE